MRVVIKPAGLFIIIVVIAALSSFAFFGMPRPRTAAVAQTSDKPERAKLPAAATDLFGEGVWKLAMSVPETAELQVSTGAVPGVGEPVKIHRVLVKKAVTNPWDVTLFQVTPATLVKNEKLRLTFRARSDDAAPFTANFEQNSAPHPKSGALEVSTTREWNLYTLEFASLDNYAPNKSQTTFHLGLKKGTLEVADMHLYRIAQ